MKRIQMTLVLLALVAVCAGSAQADTIDPGLIIAGGRGSLSLTGATLPLTYPGQPGCITGTSLTDVNGIPVPTSDPLYGLPFMRCIFQNNSPGPFTNVQFNITSAQLPLTLQCNVLCSSFTQTPSGGVATFFFNPPIENFGPTQEFGVYFVNFLDGTSFQVSTNVVPEPGTMALLLTGLGALAVRRRKARV